MARKRSTENPAVRSRACEECRRRKVKCDESIPTCKRCSSTGLSCSGPLQGTIFLDMTSKVTSSRSAATRRKRSPRSVCYENDDASISQPARLAANKVHTTLADQPSSAAFVDEQYIAQFLESMCSVREGPPKGLQRSWLFALKDICSSNSSTSLIPAIRSVIMILHGSLRNDRSATTAAYEWYTIGLKTQRTQLQLLLQEEQIPNVDTILTSAVFIIFEMLTGTTPKGHTHHSNATIRLLAMAGPSNCQTGLLHQLFRSMRGLDAMISIMTAQKATFGSEEWRTIPFTLHPKSNLEKLNDILLTIPDSVTPLRHGDLTARTEETKELVKSRALETISKLHSWWLQYSDQDPLHRKASEPEPLPARDRIQPFPDPQEYYSTLDAKTIAFFNTGYIVLGWILANKVRSCTEQQAFFRLLALRHSSSALSVAAYQESTRRSGGDFVQAMFPLLFVSVLSPSPEQRGVARDALQRWSNTFLVKGGAYEIKMPHCLLDDGTVQS